MKEDIHSFHMRHSSFICSKRLHQNQATIHNTKLALVINALFNQAVPQEWCVSIWENPSKRRAEGLPRYPPTGLRTDRSNDRPTNSTDSSLNAETISERSGRRDWGDTEPWEILLRKKYCRVYLHKQQVMLWNKIFLVRIQSFFSLLPLIGTSSANELNNENIRRCR